ncbi:protein kinase domain-containing protein [Roseimaritima sediminicola]|uniref:protein kinase domain-containing protein n=1 Tax=Roseimaritima sediminicola TaxID=2662066 RepID=UPI001298329B|nr:protein kinase [Roseimaritima sediminicola]
MRLRCPECQHRFRIPAAKPGRYQPRCKRCGRRFRLTIDAGDPPRVQVSRIAPSESHDQPEHTIAADAAIAAERPPHATPPPVASSIPEEPPAGEPVPTPADNAVETPKHLGGYRVVRLIGMGSMGAVYEARQLSLDRTVALKTILPRWSDQPSSMARFTREAYAAAQLAHPNVVRIYDFGFTDGRYYFSMEWVRGGSLADAVRRSGPMAPLVAAGYILQAARGLQYAHRMGMIHRDVKPANLLLDDDGTVKVADLGLVKLPDQNDFSGAEEGFPDAAGSDSVTEVTIAGSTVGTPSYMPPEQAVDAASVDHRADIYSLGCSLYHLLAGKPPFGGADVSRVLAQHRNATPVPLSRIRADIDEALGRIVGRAMARRVEDRYENLGQMIDELQTYLGVAGDSPLADAGAQAGRLKAAMEQFEAAPQAAYQTPALAAFWTAALVLPILSALLDVTWLLLLPAWVMGLAGGYLVPATWFGNSPLQRHLHQWVRLRPWQSWAVAATLVLVWGVGVVLMGWSVAAVALAFFGTACGAGLWASLQWRLSAVRREAMKSAERVLREMRIGGVDEIRLREFIAGHGGRHWQAFFEALFGYEALERERERLAQRKQPTTDPLAGRIRAAVIRWLQRRIEAARLAEDRKKLARVEQQGLRATGMNDAQAEAEAWRRAAAVIEASRSAMAEAGQDEGRPGESPLAAIDAKATAALKRARIKAMLADARSGAATAAASQPAGPPAPPARLLGPTPRLVVGAVLLLLFGVWAHHNRLFGVRGARLVLHSVEEALPEHLSDPQPGEDAPEPTAAPENGAAPENAGESETTASSDAAAAIEAGTVEADGPPPPTYRPLPLVGRWLDGVPLLVAGLLLVLSAGVSSWRMSLFAYPVAAIALWGAMLGIPAAGPLSAQSLSFVVAGVLFVVGVFASHDPAADTF